MAAITTAGIIAAGALGAASGLGNTALSWGANKNLQQSEQAFNAEQAAIQREWEEKMSSTAYQRAVTDMRKAGLNPAMLSAGGGASTPAGSSARSGGAHASGQVLDPQLLQTALSIQSNERMQKRELANRLAIADKNTARAIEAAKAQTEAHIKSAEAYKNSRIAAAEAFAGAYGRKVGRYISPNNGGIHEL